MHLKSKMKKMFWHGQVLYVKHTQPALQPLAHGRLPAYVVISWRKLCWKAKRMKRAPKERALTVPSCHPARNQRFMSPLLPLHQKEEEFAVLPVLSSIVPRSHGHAHRISGTHRQDHSLEEQIHTDCSQTLKRGQEQKSFNCVVAAQGIRMMLKEVAREDGLDVPELTDQILSVGLGCLASTTDGPGGLFPVAEASDGGEP